MFNLDECTKQIQDLNKKVLNIEESLDISKLEHELSELEDKTLKQDFWDDSASSAKILSRITNLKKKTSDFRKIEKELSMSITILI